MIAAIRVRFTPTPASAVWSDQVFTNWLNPGIQFSLAHFWRESSFGFADLRFTMFPPIVMDDPRLALSPADRQINAKSRPALVNGIIATVTDTFHPDWSDIDGLLIWGAQDKTDLFGGGSYGLPLPLADGGPLDFIFGGPDQQYKNVPVAVCDIASPFDAICQELGHAYGFEHPLDVNFEEYGDPYDSMASEKYGGHFSSMFKRPVMPQLPVGADATGTDVERNIGPYISAAHLYNSPFGDRLKAYNMFVDVPPSYATGAASFTLHARDTAIVAFPAVRLRVAAVIPPVTPTGATYFLELRRIGGYDAGLHIDANDQAKPPAPPLGIVIHYYDKSRKRVVYVDVLPLANHLGDRDYHSFTGGFTFRVTNIGPDFRSVGITIGGREFWRNFGVNIDETDKEVLHTSQTDWTKVDISPCFMFAPGGYFYYLKYKTNKYTLVVSSFGYEQPTYVWTVNGVVLDPTVHSAKVSASVEIPGPVGKSIATALVSIEYTVGADRLEIQTRPEAGNLSLFVEVKSVESSPGVLKNLYEDKTQVTSVRFDNIEVVWDDNYKRAQKACEDALERVNEKHIPLRRATRPTPEDPLRVRELENVIDEVANIGLGVLQAAVTEVTRIGTIVKGQLSKRQ
ncbi:MAG: hypothetical protein ABJF01_18420 [bacterium]